MLLITASAFAYGHQPWKDGSSHWWALPIKKHSPLITWLCTIMWQTKSSNLHYKRVYGHQIWQDGNLPGRIPTRMVGMAVGLDLARSWFCEISWQTKTIISPFPQCLWLPNLVGWWHARVPTGFKDGWIMTYLDKFLPKKSHDPLITWSCKVTWERKAIISPRPESLWAPNSTGW